MPMVIGLVVFGNQESRFPMGLRKRGPPILGHFHPRGVSNSGRAPDSDDTRVLIVPSITDNRGNGAVLNKLMSTRFPSSAVLMELASYMKTREMRTIVEWAPREFNREADRLANGIVDSLDPAKRLQVSPISLKWNILLEALKAERGAERR